MQLDESITLEQQELAAHILAVDDDPSVRQMIADYLADYGVRVSSASSGAQMRDILARESIDLLILDLGLPGEDGLQLAQEVRVRSRMPIIVVTGRREEADRVMTLELGADDYLTKPFSPRELLARIRSVLRRTRGSANMAENIARVRALRFSGWELNVRLRKLLAPDGAAVALSNGEFNLLVAFLSAPKRVLTREQLLDLSRLHGAEVFDRSIDVQVGRLRRKLGRKDEAAGLITTERGVGYIFHSDVGVVSV